MHKFAHKLITTTSMHLCFRVCVCVSGPKFKPGLYFFQGSRVCFYTRQQPVRGLNVSKWKDEKAARVPRDAH